MHHRHGNAVDLVVGGIPDPRLVAEWDVFEVPGRGLARLLVANLQAFLKPLNVVPAQVGLFVLVADARLVGDLNVNGIVL